MSRYFNILLSMGSPYFIDSHIASFFLSRHLPVDVLYSITDCTDIGY